MIAAQRKVNVMTSLVDVGKSRLPGRQRRDDSTTLLDSSLQQISTIIHRHQKLTSLRLYRIPIDGTGTGSDASAVGTIAMDLHIPSQKQNLVGAYSGLLELLFQVGDSLLRFVQLLRESSNCAELLLRATDVVLSLSWVKAHGHRSLGRASRPLISGMGRSRGGTVGEDIILEGIRLTRDDESEGVDAPIASQL